MTSPAGSCGSRRRNRHRSGAVAQRKGPDCSGAFLRGDPAGRAVPGDTWRAHFASPRGAGRLFCLRADACGLCIGEADCFFRLRGWRTRGLRGRPLVNHRRPRPFPPWESTLNVRTSEILHRRPISFGPTADGTSSISPFARWINRASSMMSGTDRFEARSTPG